MVSDNVSHDTGADPPSSKLIPVGVEHIDQIVAIARDLSGFMLILDAGATGDPTLAAVERILRPINEQIQDFKRWFHDAWHVAAGESSTM